MAVERITQSIETYIPSGKFNPVGIPIMLLVGGGLGMAAAFLVHLIWVFTGYYLIFIFPAAIGFAAGFGLSMGIGVGKCRSKALGMVVGLAIGLLSYISMHYFDSLSYGAPDLLSYLQAIADEGYVIFFIPISGTVAWITWIIEIALVLFLTVGIAGGSAAEPFCEDCNQWCEEKTLFTSANRSSDQMITALRDQDYNHLSELSTEGFNERNKLVADLSYCEKCMQNGYLTLKRITPKGDGDDTEEDTLISGATIAPGGLDTLLKAFPAVSA